MLICCRLRLPRAPLAQMYLEWRTNKCNGNLSNLSGCFCHMRYSFMAVTISAMSD